MKRIFVAVLTIFIFVNVNAQEKKANLSFALKGGVNHFYDNAPSGQKNFPFNFAGGADLEYSINRFLGFGAEYIYLDLDRKIQKTVLNDYLTSETHDFSGFFTVNISNLVAPKRTGAFWNIYLKGGAGISFYHYKNEATNFFVKGNNSKNTMVAFGGLVSELNITKLFVFFIEGQYRYYDHGCMTGFANGGENGKYSKAWTGLAGIRYKFGANQKNHIKNGRQTEILQQPITSMDEKRIEKANENDDKEAIKVVEKPVVWKPQEALPDSAEVGIDNGYIVVNEAFDDLLFDFGKYEIKKESSESLDQLVKILKKYPNATVKLLGYTDNVGTATYNKKLSRQRSQAVKKYLIDKGINEANITATGFGFENPTSTNATPDGRTANRRVEIYVKK